MTFRGENFWKLIDTLRNNCGIEGLDVCLKHDQHGKFRAITIKGQQLVIRRHRVSFRPVSLAVIATSIKLEANKMKQQEIEQAYTIRTRYGWAHR